MSISKKIVFVNMPLLLAMLMLFLLITGVSKNELDGEIQAANKRTLHTFHTNVERETKRLSNLLFLCRDDASFILALSGKTETFFVGYAMQASKQLTIIKNSLPYAERVFAYSVSQRKFILANNAILSKDVFLEEFSELLAEGENLPDFSKIEDGFTLYGKFILYVKNIENYGPIVIQFRQESFLQRTRLDAELVHFEYMAFTKNGKLLLSSLSQSIMGNERLRPSDMTTGTIFRSGGGTYEVYAEKDILSGFTYVVLKDTRTMLYDQYYYNILFVVGIGGLLLLSSLILLTNSSLYRPLKFMVQRISGEGNYVGDELKVIENSILALQSERNAMSQQIATMKQIQLNMALGNLMYSDTTGYIAVPDVIRRLEKLYPRFLIVMVSSQRDDGLPGSSFLRHVDDLLSTEKNCIRIEQTRFRRVYLYSGADSQNVLCQYLDDFFSDEPSEEVSFAGVSDVSYDILKLRTACNHAYDAMMRSPVSGDGRRQEHSIGWEDGLVPGKWVIRLEEQSILQTSVLSGMADDICDVIRNILFAPEGSNPLSLGDMQRLYSDMSALLGTVINTVHIETNETRMTSPDDAVFHPGYAFRALCHDYQMACRSYAAKQGSLKYKMTQYINTHFSDDISLNSLADKFGLTPSYLSAWFKKNIGRNLSVYLSVKRMEESKRILLENPDTKVSDVAEKVGISNVMTFIRQFKSHVGTTPDRYRKLNRQNEMK